MCNLPTLQHRYAFRNARDYQHHLRLRTMTVTTAPFRNARDYQHPLRLRTMAVTTAPFPNVSAASTVTLIGSIDPDRRDDVEGAMTQLFDIDTPQSSSYAYKGENAFKVFVQQH